MFFVFGTFSEEDTTEEITIFRLQENQCIQVTILKDERFISDYDTLAECGKDIEIIDIDEDVVYLKQAKTHIDSFVSINLVDQYTIDDLLDGTISFSECSENFEVNALIYQNIRIKLENMNVPPKFTNIHSHLINAIAYVEEGAKIISQDCSDEELLNQATEKFLLGTNEMNVVTELLLQL